MLVIDDVQFDYPAARGQGDGFAFRLGELSVRRGETVAVIGPSGCGKSTLLRLAAGTLRPRTGTVRLDGVDVAGLGEAAIRALRLRSIGFVFQDFRLLDHLDVEENAMLPFRLGGLRADAAARARVVELLERLGIGHLRRRPIGRLSHGERQRTAIARALATDPGLVLADEPTGNLDPSNKRIILEALIATARDRDAALLAVTHDHDLLDAFDRVIDLGTEVSA